MEFERQYNKYYVLKQEDVMVLLTGEQRHSLQGVFDTIQKGREQLGKKDNTYIVVNEDEPYAWVVWKLIELSLTDPEGLRILLTNLKVEVLGY